MKDAKHYLAATLVAYAAAQPGRVPALIQAHVPPEAQQQLQGYLQAAGVALV